MVRRQRINIVIWHIESVIWNLRHRELHITSRNQTMVGDLKADGLRHTHLKTALIRHTVRERQRHYRSRHVGLVLEVQTDVIPVFNLNTLHIPSVCNRLVCQEDESARLLSRLDLYRLLVFRVLVRLYAQQISSLWNAIESHDTCGIRIA